MDSEHLKMGRRQVLLGADKNSQVAAKETTKSTLKLCDLPPEILLMILGYLKDDECQKLRTLSKKMRKIVDSRSIAVIALNYSSPWLGEVVSRQYIGELAIEDVPSDRDLPLDGMQGLKKVRLLDSDHETTVDYLRKGATSLQELKIICNRFLNHFQFGSSPLHFDRLKSLRKIDFQFPAECSPVRRSVQSNRLGEYFFLFFHATNFDGSLTHFALKSETQTHSNVILSLFHFMNKHSELKTLQFHVPITNRPDNWSAVDHLIIQDTDLAKSRLSDLDIGMDVTSYPIWNQLLRTQSHLVVLKINFNGGSMTERINPNFQIISEPVLRSHGTLADIQFTGLSPSPRTPFSCSVFEKCSGLKNLLLHHVSVRSQLRNKPSLSLVELEALPISLAKLEIVGLTFASEDLTVTLEKLINLVHLTTAYCGEGPFYGFPFQKLLDIVSDMKNLKLCECTPGVFLEKEALATLQRYIINPLKSDTTFRIVKKS